MASRPTGAPNAGGVGKLRFSISLRLRRFTAKICVHPPWRPAFTTARWRKNARCHQQFWRKSKSDDHSYGPAADINNVGCTKVCRWYSRHCMIAERNLSLRCVYKTMQVAEWNVVVAESAHQADTRSVCVIRTTVEHFKWHLSSRGSLGDSWASCNNRFPREPGKPVLTPPLLPWENIRGMRDTWFLRVTSFLLPCYRIKAMNELKSTEPKQKKIIHYSL